MVRYVLLAIIRLTLACIPISFANRLPGEFCAGIPISKSKLLEEREKSLDGEDEGEEKKSFLRFMRKMLQWDPEKRSSARELADDEWVQKYSTEDSDEEPE